MKINVLILFAVLSIFFISCDKNMKWINPTDSQTDQAEIDKICKDGGYECGDIIATYKDVKIEINCGECSDGYECSNNKCFDIDECKNPDLNNCPEHSTCANKEGTYSCVCDENYTWIDSECVENPQDDADTDDSADSVPNNDSDLTDPTPDESDSTPDEDSDTDTTPTTPCNPNPCDSVENSTGVCSISDSDYLCGCNSGYFWNEGKCKRITLGNICTGQNKCFNESEEITCPTSETADFYGQDAQYAKAGYCYPQSFTLKTVSGKNIVVDNNTGLEWQQVISTDTFAWDDAVSHCNSLTYAGYTDWRLPTPQELITIVDSGKYSPTIDVTYFTDTPNGRFWTSLLAVSDANTAWIVNFDGGSIGKTGDGSDTSTSQKYYVRCVRGKNILASSFETFKRNNDDVVRDTTTGLMWQATYDGTEEDGRTWLQALSYCENLEYAGYTDWRLPNKNELAQLVNYDKYEPASDFPEMPSFERHSYSSTTFPRASEQNKTTIDVKFSSGHIGTGAKSKSTAGKIVRCVRSERINDPCENHICGSVAHSSGVCVPENAFEYSCTCDEGYFWNGTQCKIMPECSASSGTPCKDSTSKLTWSAKAEDTMDWQTAINYCSNYIEGGLSGWHLPNIDELKTLLVWSKASSCQVSEVNDCLALDGCWTCSTCTQTGTQSSSGTGCSDWGTSYSDGRYSKFGEIGGFWSSSTRSNSTDTAWYVLFHYGGVSGGYKTNDINVRCVRK